MRGEDSSPKARRRETLDLESYVRRARDGPCFVCKTVAREPDHAHHILYEDDSALAFLSRYPTLYGYALVGPREHREQVTGDFSAEEYLGLQRIVYRVSEAGRREVGTERVYILSLGSDQSNAHVHWHIGPLPPGVPYEEQQFHALMAENGVLRISEEDKSSLAARLRRRIEQSANRGQLRVE